jgi:hypothetical protein
MTKHKTISVDERSGITRSIYETNELSTLVLKGHLYVEFVLNELFISKWPNSSTMVNRFSFENKILIAEGTGLITNEWALASARGLNQVRNLYAHSLIPEGVEDKIAEIRLLDPAVDHRVFEPLAKIKVITLSLCGFVSGLMEGASENVPEWLIIGGWDRGHGL